MAIRCPNCLIVRDLCFCEDLIKVSTQSRIDIILDKAELRFTNNTALLSKNSIDRCYIHVKGLPGKPIDYQFVDELNYQPIYLYPSQSARELTSEFVSSFDKPVQLIVPDGTWAQADRFSKKQELLHIPRVKVSAEEKSIYKLRKQVYEYGLCTHEAIAHALGVIEGDDLKRYLLHNLKLMVNAHRKGRNHPNYKLRYFYENTP